MYEPKYTIEVPCIHANPILDMLTQDILASKSYLLCMF